MFPPLVEDDTNQTAGSGWSDPPPLNLLHACQPSANSIQVSEPGKSAGSQQESQAYEDVKGIRTLIQIDNTGVYVLIVSLDGSVRRIKIAEDTDSFFQILLGYLPRGIDLSGKSSITIVMTLDLSSQGSTSGCIAEIHIVIEGQQYEVEISSPSTQPFFRAASNLTEMSGRPVSAPLRKKRQSRHTSHLEPVEEEHDPELVREVEKEIRATGLPEPYAEAKTTLQLAYEIFTQILKDSLLDEFNDHEQICIEMYIQEQIKYVSSEPDDWEKGDSQRILALAGIISALADGRGEILAEQQREVLYLTIALVLGEPEKRRQVLQQLYLKGQQLKRALKNLPDIDIVGSNHSQSIGQLDQWLFEANKILPPLAAGSPPPIDAFVRIFKEWTETLQPLYRRYCRGD